MPVNEPHRNCARKKNSRRFKRVGNIRLVDIQYPSNYSFTWHYDRYSKLSIVLSGKIREEFGKSEEEYASSASFVIKPNYVKHKDQFGPIGARVLSVIPEDDFFQEWLEGQSLTGLRWFHGLPSARSIVRLLRVVYKGGDQNELEEELIDLFGQTSPLPGMHKTGAVPDWLILLQQRLHDEYDQLIRTRDLARWIGLHPVYLARVFRVYFNCSIKEYIYELRLKKAINNLSVDKANLAQIAYDTGFVDQSHFNRTFKSALDISPGQFRKLLQSSF